MKGVSRISARLNMSENELNLDLTGNKKYLFIVSTYYHLLYSLIVIDKLKIINKAIILLRYVPESIRNLAEQLKDKGYNVVEWGEPFKKNIIGKIKYLFSVYQDRVFIKKIKKENPNSELVLMNFAWNARHVYYCAKVYFELCDIVYFFEEGVNSFSNYTGNKLYMTIKKVIGDKFDFYTEEKLKNIFVTLPEKYPIELQIKMVKVRLLDLWETIDFATRNNILTLFVSEKLLKELKNSSFAGIVYTQPLSEDGFISEKEKVQLYRELCKYYSKYGSLLLKPHPRDTTTYEIEDVKVIDRLWPSEIIQFIGIKFHFAIGICTSAVNGTDADIRVNLNDNYLNDRKIEWIPLEDLNG